MQSGYGDWSGSLQVYIQTRHLPWYWFIPTGPKVHTFYIWYHAPQAPWYNDKRIDKCILWHITVFIVLMYQTLPYPSPYCYHTIGSLKAYLIYNDSIWIWRHKPPFHVLYTLHLIIYAQDRGLLCFVVVVSPHRSVYRTMHFHVITMTS